MNRTIPLISLLILSLLLGTAVYAQPELGNSYVNLTRKTTGGPVQPNDILEIRMTVMIPWGFNGGSTGFVYRTRYHDNVPSNTVMLTSSTDSLRVITNEGVTFKKYTLGSGDDAGTYLASPPAGEKQIRINLGSAPTTVTTNLPGSIAGSSSINVDGDYPYGDQPKWWTGHIFSTSFRVRVSGAVGSIITLGAGEFRYRLFSSGGTDVVLNTTQYTILIGAPQNLCANTVGTNFANEFGGSFGSGTSLNRASVPTFVIPGYVYNSNINTSNNLDDGHYAILKNTSRFSHPFPNVRRPPNCAGGTIASTDSCKYRMFEHWDINGDHTGTTTSTGNAPPAAATSSGYMLVINADYVTSEAYRQTISGLCPNTYYEFSAWIKNICQTCGVTPNLANTYLPGVYPNLTFEIDDVDQYNTGEIGVAGWVKKGFVFITGAAQTSVTLSIRNNAPGGGGNDWALDDITLATCTPNLILTPSPTAVACYGDQIDLSCDIRSVFSNYTRWVWEVSNDGGSTWANTATSGTGSPTLVSGEYQYEAQYPSFLGDSNTHADRYRIRVATTAANLASATCSFTATSTVEVRVNNCMWVLETDITSFTGKIDNSKASLQWISTSSDTKGYFEIEKSTDNIDFRKIGTVSASANDVNNAYSFSDPAPLNQPTWYRIKLTDGKDQKYTKIITLTNGKYDFEINSVVNPFASTLSMDLLSPSNDVISITITDLYGSIQYRKIIRPNQGESKIELTNLHNLTPGIYILQAKQNGKSISKKVMKVATR